ncbi:DUF1572 family protein [Bacillus sp. REN3]|uniref:DUF1572 family protein n=1 Tax=Bacillus sp. REN3 TaxID=2802440 RepID=UPI001AEDC8E5|nr:DUF1572 family protein [Bacillus sp. REN3]
MDWIKLVDGNFRDIKNLAERAMDQLTIEELNYAPNEESNSISILVRHMSGYLKSRFKDFLTTDGEKPDRNRDAEFEGTYTTKDELLKCWNSGWEVLFATLDDLDEGDLEKTVYIRSEPHKVMEAIMRQVVHHSSHAGQIVYIGKLIKSNQWKTLSIPRRQSEQFNKGMMDK